jgi:hypothetical protein
MDNWTVTLPGQALLSLVIAIAVYFDALMFGRRHGWERGFPSLSPVAWAIFVLLFSLIGTPWYVIRRIRLTRSPSRRDAAVREREERIKFRTAREAEHVDRETEPSA